MRISFFEVEDWERDYLKNRLKGHELLFFKDPLAMDNVEKAKDTEILSVFIYSDASEPVLGEMPELKMIATRSTGYDHIDLIEAKRRGIAVSNVPSYGENTVAEHTFALILSLSRRLYKACIKRLTHDTSPEGLTGFDLMGKTLGVIGTGRIGLHVIRIAKGFGMEVIASDVHPGEILSEVMGFKYVPLEELLQKSQIVTIHVPYNRQTEHLINKERFALMRKGSYLINTARGGVVDTDALIQALDNGTLAGAGIDVLEGEGLIKEERSAICDFCRAQILAGIAKNAILLQHQNVVYTPHIAFDSREALERILNTTVENINGFLSGKPLNVVSAAPVPEKV